MLQKHLVINMTVMIAVLSCLYLYVSVTTDYIEFDCSFFRFKTHFMFPLVTQ